MIQYQNMQGDDHVTENMLSIMESGGTFFLLEQFHNLEKIINYCYILKENDLKEIEKSCMSLQNYRDKNPIEIAVREAIMHIENITSEIAQSNFNVTENRQNLNIDDIKLENNLTDKKDCDKLEHCVRELETQNKNLNIELTDFKTRYTDISSDLEQQMDEGFRLRTEVNRFMESEKQCRMALSDMITHTGLAVHVNEMTMQEMISAIYSSLVELNGRLPGSILSTDRGKIDATVQVEECKLLETLPSIVESIGVVSQCDRSMETDNTLRDVEMWTAAFMNIEHTIDEALREYEQFFIPVESLPTTGMGDHDSSRDRFTPIVVSTDTVGCASAQNISSLEQKLGRLVRIMTSLQERRNRSGSDAELADKSAVATISEPVVNIGAELDALTSQHNALLLRHEEVMSLYTESESALASLKSLADRLQSENDSLMEQLVDKAHELDEYSKNTIALSLQVETTITKLASSEDRFGREMADATALLEDRNGELLTLRGELSELIRERDTLKQHHDDIVERLNISLESHIAKTAELESMENRAAQLRLDNSKLADELASCTVQLESSNNDLLSRSGELATVRNTLILAEERFIQETESLTSAISMKERELAELNENFQQSLREKEIIVIELEKKCDNLQLDLNEKISHAGNLSDENEILKLQIEEKDGLIQNLEVELDRKCEKIRSLDEHVIDLDSKILNSELEYHQIIDELNNEVLKSVSSKEQLLIEKELLGKKMAELASLVANHEDALRDLSEIRNKLTVDLSNAKSALEEELVQSEHNRRAILSNELLINNLNTELTNNKTELDSVNDLLRMNRIELEKMTLDSQKNASHCELLEKEMGTLRALLDNKETLANSKDEEIEKANAIIDDLNRKLVLLNNEVNDLKFRCEPIARPVDNELLQEELNEKNENLKSQCRSLENSLAVSQHECEVMKEKALKANQTLAKDKKNFNMKIKDLESQIETLAANNTGFCEENIITLKKDLEHYEEEIRKMKLEIEEKDGILINQEREVRKLELTIKDKDLLLKDEQNNSQTIRKHYDEIKERYKLKRNDLTQKAEEIKLLEVNIEKLKADHLLEINRLKYMPKTEEIECLRSRIEKMKANHFKEINELKARYRSKRTDHTSDAQIDSSKSQINESKTKRN